jgi:hypothetical protein
MVCPFGSLGRTVERATENSSASSALVWVPGLVQSDEVGFLARAELGGHSAGRTPLRGPCTMPDPRSD